MAKQNRKQEDSRDLTPDLERVLRNFVACDRCSFFLAGYRVIHGLDDLEEAADNQSGQWLPLSWNHETRQLVYKSYGGRLDVELYYYDSQCPVCRRRFTYNAGKEEGEQPSFRIEIK